MSAFSLVAIPNASYFTEYLKGELMKDSENTSNRITYYLLLIVSAGLIAAFLYGVRTVLVAPVTFVALVVLLWQYREHSAVTTILRVMTGIFLVYMMVVLKPLIPVVVISALLLVLLRPPVEWMVHKGVPRAIAVVLMMGGAFLVIAAIVAMIVPAIVDQSQLFINLLPIYYDRIQTKIVGDWIPYLQSIPFLSGIDFSVWREKLPQVAQRALQAIANTSGTLAKTTGNTISQILNLFLIPIIVLYMLLDKRTIIERTLQLIPTDKAKPWRDRSDHVIRILSRWLRGQIFVSVCDGVMIGIGLAIIGIDYALTIGMMTIVLSFIPYIGLITSFAISILLALSGGGGLSTIIGVVIVYIVVQVVEGYVVVPKVMGRAVGLSDLTTIIALTIGAHLFGLIGMLFAVPVTAISWVLVREWWASRNGEETSEARE